MRDRASGKKFLSMMNWRAKEDSGNASVKYDPRTISFFDSAEIFKKPWGISDVAIRCRNSLGEEADLLIHVNKMMIASFSPVFKTLFFGDFAESKQDIVTVDVSYSFMMGIVQILYNVRDPVMNTCKIHLSELYMTAEKYDFPLIRDYVKEILFEMKPAEALKLAIDLEFEREKERLLKKMSKDDVTAFLKENKDTLLTTAEVAEMLEKFGDSLSLNEAASPVTLQNDLIPENFDREWGNSNVVLRAENGRDTVLHANKSVLATFSPFFEKLFFAEGTDELQNVVDLDIEYDVLLEILRILHHVNRKFVKKNKKIFDISLLVKLYRTAAEFEIEAIKTFCKDRLFLSPRADAFLASCELGLENERKELFSMMTVEDFDCICEKLRHSEEKLFTAREMAEAMRRLRVEMNEMRKPRFGFGK